MKNGCSPFSCNTRGVRNNNPFNIKVSSNRWKGKIPQSEKKDKTFEEFYNLQCGIRAGVLLLKHYIADGCDTVDKIITRFAPPVENYTQNYINYARSFVNNDGSVPFDAPIAYGSESVDFYHLCYAICMYESEYRLTPTFFREVFTLFPELNDSKY